VGEWWYPKRFIPEVWVVMSSNILIVDLFAGPGGLGEGFSSFSDSGRRPFKLAASVERDASAHMTLTLRAFFRQFDRAPDQYYEYVRAGNPKLRKELFGQFQSESEAAISETLEGPRALGDEKDHGEIIRRVKAATTGHEGPRVVIGGPPCQAYSVVGRARNKGIDGYTPEGDKRHFLYREYLEILDEVQPEVFVMENVRGILSAKVHGKLIFDAILNDLKNPGKVVRDIGGAEYEIFSLVAPLPEPDALGDRSYSSTSDYLIRAEEYGVPQTRHRVILLGVRRDVLKRHTPSIVVPEPSTYLNTYDAIADLPELRSGLTKVANTPSGWAENLQQAAKAVRKALSEEGCEVPSSFPFNGAADFPLSQGGNFVRSKAPSIRGGAPNAQFMEWCVDPRVGGYLNHRARSHMPADIYRYLFACSYAIVNGGASPTAKDFPESFVPQHKNWQSGHFVDRFKVQARNRIPSTVTSHIAKDGHYFIHFDPLQCRSLTVREAARIQTFPDNYYFEGNRTQQYVQVGNAVPPLLAKKIAEVVYSLLK